ncbi:MAG: hypothetical protein LBC38_04955 [Oscillospiraceae bacterium]|nr:hypothetical protein [Oscillospiraceae bacterium]
MAKIIGRAIIAAVVLAIVAAMLLGSPIFYTSVPALSIGEYDYTAAEYNYYFNSIYAQYAYFIDSSTPLSKQDSLFGEGTWEEYFRGQTENSLQQISMLYDAGKKENFTIPELDAEDPDYIRPAAEQVASMKAQAAQSGYGDFDEYLVTSYGKGMSEELFTGLMERAIYASAYQLELTRRKTAELTDEVLDAKYAEIGQEQDLQTYYIYTVSAELDPTTGGITDEALADAKAKADALNAVHNGDDFAELVLEYAPEESKETYRLHNASLVRNKAANSGADYDDWLKSPERKQGDSEIFSAPDSYTVVLFESRNYNQFHRADYVDVVVAAETDAESGEYTSQTLSAAKSLADQLLADWAANEQTQETFTALNDLNTTAGAAESGLKTDVALGVSAYELEDWLFDPDRKEGDTTIVYVESNGNNAYHILYFAGAEEQRYDRVLAKNQILTDYSTQWNEEHIGDFPITERFGFNFRVK